MVWGPGVSVEPAPPRYPVGVSVLRNRRFLLVAVPIFVVAVGLVVAYLLLRPTIRRNAAILVESKLEVVIGVVEEVWPPAAAWKATARSGWTRPPSRTWRFRAADDPSDEPLVVSVLATDEVWTGTARKRTRACYFVRSSTRASSSAARSPGATARRRSRARRPRPGGPSSEVSGVGAATGSRTCGFCPDHP